LKPILITIAGAVLMSSVQFTPGQPKVEGVEKETTAKINKIEEKPVEPKATVEAKPVAKPVVKVAQVAPVAVTGNCADWIAQAGITATGSVMALIGGESGCNPRAYNQSSGACGIPQSLPCSKMGCSLDDPVCQLRWMDSYVKSRYGTWDNAYATWLSRSPHWY